MSIVHYTWLKSKIPYTGLELTGFGHKPIVKNINIEILAHVITHVGYQNLENPL